MIFEYVGFVAAILATLTFAPQVLKTLKTRQTRDISLSMLFLSLGGNTCWIIYALGLNSIPILASSIVTSLMLFTLIFLKLNEKQEEVIISEV